MLSLGLACINALGGCALPGSQVPPQAIQQPPRGDLQLVETLAAPQIHTGTNVRWGGNVIRIDRDQAGNALIQIIERRLDEQGRPIEGSASDGRFIIKATSGVDPRFYARDRLITVAGTVDGAMRAQVGDSQQLLPVVRVHEFMLWLPRAYDDPWWHHDHDRYGPNIRFGVGISNLQHHNH